MSSANASVDDTDPADSPAVKMTPVDAFGCGAAGCHVRDDLRRVTTPDRTRVLCPEHVAAVLNLEVGR